MKAYFWLAIVAWAFLGCAPVNRYEPREIPTGPSYYDYDTYYEHWYNAPALKEFQ